MRLSDTQKAVVEGRQPAEALADVVVGEWAHVRYGRRQHLVAAVEPDVDSAEPVRLACGRRTWTRSIWQGAPKPHCPRCVQCERSSAVTS